MLYQIHSTNHPLSLYSVPQRQRRDQPPDVLPPPLLRAQAGQEVRVSAREEQLH